METNPDEFQLGNKGEFNKNEILDEFDPLKSQETQQQQPNQLVSEGSKETHSVIIGQSSTAAEMKFSDIPPLDFDLFIQRLRHPSSYVLVRYFKSFLKEFHKKKWTYEQQIKIVFDFLQFINKQLKQTGQWKNENEEVFEMAREGWEKLLTRKLYSDLFGHNSDLQEDFSLKKIIFLHGWIEEKHLDMKFVSGTDFEPFLMLISQEFVKMDSEFKSPRDKLVCILNVCRIILSFIEQEHIHASADDFLPVLIYCIIKTSPIRIKSNLLFVSRFRNPDKLKSEAGYYLTNLMGAISFIENLTLKSLTIDESLYTENYTKSLELWETNESIKAKKEIFSLSEHDQQHSKAGVKRTESAVSDILVEASNAGKNIISATSTYLSKIFSDGNPRSSSPSTLISRPHSRSTSNRVSNPGTPEPSSYKEDNSSNDDNYEYELQMAVALSLSMEESKKSQND